VCAPKDDQETAVNFSAPSAFGLGSLLCVAMTASPARADEASLRAVYKELVETNTTLSVGSCTKAAEAMAARLKAAGLPASAIHVIVPPKLPAQGNLVAELPGSSPSAGAILLLAHIDVVEAKREDWERDPFTLIEENGYFYGRGSADDKAMAAIFVDLVASYQREGYRPSRPIKLALTCGEETPYDFNGVQYLLESHRDLIKADLALNEGGGGRLSPTGERLYNGVLAGEKVYQDFRLEIRNPGGHSSRPTRDNAIYRLAAALERLQAYEFPVELNDTTRAFFERMAEIEPGKIAADMRGVLATPRDDAALMRLEQDPTYNSILHTTCVATMLEAGHAPNALPQRATANVNCRIFPGHTQEEIRDTLKRVVADDGIDVAFADPPEQVGAPPPLTEDVVGPIRLVTKQLWPNVPVLFSMAAGATDARFLTPAGIPTYGVSGLFSDPATTNAHGLNERMRVQSLLEGREFLDRLVRIYAGGR
jgi:acetylornithine deacetylase/succinyl-diaminopimelate desuccinylase-like protein